MSHGGTPPLRDFLCDDRWPTELAKALSELIVCKAGQGTAVFDFDDTLLDGDLSLALLAHQERIQPNGQREHYEAACKRDVRAGYAELVETLIVGRTEPEVRQQTREVLEAGLASGRLRIRTALAELIWAMQRHGWDVWVVTASPAVVIAVAAQRFGIPANRVLGMWCKSVDGRFVAPTQEPVTYRQGKVDALEGAGVPNWTFAAGDAPTDLEMLNRAEYGLVVDRGNPVLSASATTNGWWITSSL